MGTHSSVFANGIVAISVLVASACKHNDNVEADLSENQSSPSSDVFDNANLVSSNPGVEAATTAGLITAIKKGIEGFRDAHPKAHGCFDDVTMTVRSDLPKAFQNELFLPSKTYQTAIRISHGASNKTASDLVNDLHGFALKIFLNSSFEQQPPITAKLPLIDPATRQAVGQLDINEMRLTEAEGVGEKYYHSVDIVTINAIHEFMVNGLADYRDFFAAGGVLKELIPHMLQNKGTLPSQLSNPALTPALAVINPAIEKGPRYQEFKSGTLNSQMMPALIVEIKNAVFDVVFHTSRGGSTGPIAQLTHLANGHRSWDLLQSSFQSFVPYRYGGDAKSNEGPAVKYQIQAIDCVSKVPMNLDNQPVPPAYVRPFLADAERGKNYLGEVIKSQVQNQDHCFALNAQPWKIGYPSLDAAAGVWGERTYTNIAELKIEKGSRLMDPNKCEKLSFNPGHGPAEFQGAGEIQRARRLIYSAIETLRNQQDLSAK